MCGVSGAGRCDAARRDTAHASRARAGSGPRNHTHTPLFFRQPSCSAVQTSERLRLDGSREVKKPARVRASRVRRPESGQRLAVRFGGRVF